MSRTGVLSIIAVCLWGCGAPPNSAVSSTTQDDKPLESIQSATPMPGLPPSAPSAPAANSRFIGDWQTHDESSTEPNIFLHLEADGSMTMEFKSARLSGGSFLITGTWREGDGRLYRFMRDVKLINMNPKTTNPKFESDMLDLARKQLPLGKETPNMVMWSGENMFNALDGMDKSRAFERRKKL